MKVKIEIELNPEEFRQVLGLPDIVGIQEDLVRYAREKLSQTGDFDPVVFLRDTMTGKTGARAWRKFIDVTLGAEDDEPDEPPSRRKSRATKSSKPRGDDEA